MPKQNVRTKKRARKTLMKLTAGQSIEEEEKFGRFDISCWASFVWTFTLDLAIKIKSTVKHNNYSYCEQKVPLFGHTGSLDLLLKSRYIE